MTVKKLQSHPCRPGGVTRIESHRLGKKKKANLTQKKVELLGHARLQPKEEKPGEKGKRTDNHVSKGEDLDSGFCAWKKTRADNAQKKGERKNGDKTGADRKEPSARSSD